MSRKFFLIQYRIKWAAVKGRIVLVFGLKLGQILEIF